MQEHRARAVLIDGVKPAVHAAELPLEVAQHRAGDAATARRILAVLEEHGWLRRLVPWTVLDDVARRDAWELVP